MLHVARTCFTVTVEEVPPTDIVNSRVLQSQEVGLMTYLELRGSNLPSLSLIKFKSFRKVKVLNFYLYKKTSNFNTPINYQLMSKTVGMSMHIDDSSLVQ